MFGLTPYERKNYDLFNVFRDFEKLEKEFFGDNNFMTNQFRTDIQDNEDNYLLEAELPGFNKEDINIDIEKDYLTISAEHSSSNDEKDKDGRYIHRERSYGSFQRSFNISNINADEIQAEYNNGILKLSLPKKEPTKPSSRRLEIK